MSATGYLAPLDAVRAITGAGQVNTLGFCVGGTLLATALAVMAQKRDYLGLLAHLACLDAGLFRYRRHQRLRGRGIRRTRRAGISRWRLDARKSARRDLCDAARQRPGVAFRHQQLSERQGTRSLSTCSTGTPTEPTCRAASTPITCATCTWRTICGIPGKLASCGVPVDLAQNRRAGLRAGHPRRSHRSLEDRAPERRICWADDTEFVLGASGHVAGIVNPAAKKRRHYWTELRSNAGRGRLVCRCGSNKPEAGGRTGRTGCESRSGNQSVGTRCLGERAISA